jgi:hypothetical protein
VLAFAMLAATACGPAGPAEIARANASRRTGRCRACELEPAVLAVVRTTDRWPTVVWAAAVVVHGFVACDGLPCTPVSHMLTAPNDTIAPVNRPIAGVKASRVLIDVFLPPSSGALAVVIAYQTHENIPRQH